jgi:hypothetical protein
MRTQDNNTTTSLLPVDSESVARVLGRTAPGLALGVALALLAACGGDENTEPDLDTGADTDAGGDAVTDEGANDNGGTETGTDTDTGGTTDDGTTDVVVPDTGDATDTTQPGDVTDTTVDDTGGDTTVEPETITRAALASWSAAIPPGAWGSISMMTSNGTAFAPQASWRAGSPEQPVGDGSTANLAGDFNGDGQTDLLAFFGASPSSFGALGVYVNTGSAFEPISTWRGGTAEAAIVAGSTANLVGDVNGDGNDDVIVWSGATAPPSWGGVSVYLSNGTGFDARASWRAGSPESPMVSGNTNLVGDVNGDGRDDLIAWTGRSGPSSFGAVYVLLSNGTGFDAPAVWRGGSIESPVGSGGTANLVADVNGDDCADLIVWTGVDGPGRWGGIQVALSTCSAFEAETSWLAGSPEVPVGSGATANLAGDVDGDGYADLIAWSGVTGEGRWGGVQVFRSTGTAFAAPTVWRAGSLEIPVPSGATANLVVYVTETVE